MSFEKTKPVEAAGRGRHQDASSITAIPWVCPIPRPCRKRIPWEWITFPSMRTRKRTARPLKFRPESCSGPGSSQSPRQCAFSQRRIRAPGVVKADEHRQTVVALRFDAFVEKLGHATTGSFVRQGEPMMRLYSPVLSAAAAQYLTDLGARNYTSLASTRVPGDGLGTSAFRGHDQDIERSKEGTLSVNGPPLMTALSRSTMSSKACGQNGRRPIPHRRYLHGLGARRCRRAGLA